MAELAIIGSDFQEVGWPFSAAAADAADALAATSSSSTVGTRTAFFPPSHVLVPPATQVIGTALALLLLSGGAMPLWAGVLVAAASAYLMLFLERLGVRYLEILFELLIAGMRVPAAADRWL